MWTGSLILIGMWNRSMCCWHVYPDCPVAVVLIVLGQNCDVEPDRYVESIDVLMVRLS